MVNEVVTESSLHTETTAIDASLTHGRDLDEFLFSKGVEFQLTATTAERTGRLYPVQLPSSSFDLTEIFSQSAYRADVEAFSTGDAVLFSRCFDVGGESMIGYVEYICPWDIDTAMDATETHDASVSPLPNQGSAIF
jgi:hypothetical protein